MKQTIIQKCTIFFLLLLMSGVLRAQSASGHFEWVKSYTGIQGYSGNGFNSIVNSAVDSLGNLYIAGHFTYPGGIEWDGRWKEKLFPDTLWPSAQQNIVIAKISSTGEMVWQKVIIDQSPGNNKSCYLRDMKMVGDSSIMVAVNFTTPYTYREIVRSAVYYLDTLIYDENYFYPTDSIWPESNSAFITFDFDGNVTEQHFVSIGLLDTAGHPLGAEGFTYIYGQSGFAEKFAVDHSGNIYVAHQPGNDQGEYQHNILSVEYGTIGAQVIYVDGVRHQTNPVGPTQGYNRQILKFSPHFDSLLGSTYIFDHEYTFSFPVNWINPYATTSLNIDQEDNLYYTYATYCDDIPNDTAVHIPIYNSDNFFFNTDGAMINSFILKLDSSLWPQNFRQVSRTPGPEGLMGRLMIINSYVDTASNSLFVTGNTQLDWFETSTPNLYLLYGNDSLEMRNNVFWLRLDLDSWDLLSYGKVRSTCQTNDCRKFYRTIVAKDNRVVTQFLFQNDFEYQDTAIYAPWGVGMMMWDYDGNEIGYQDFHSASSANDPGQVHLVDSVLYLTGQLFADATFGDIEAHCWDHDMAYMAKYVDTSFMHPYVKPDLREQQTIAWEQELEYALTDGPIVLTATASSGLPVAYSVADSTIAYADGNTLHLLHVGVTSVTATQSGDEYYRPAAPVTLQLTVTDGGQGEGVTAPDDAPVSVWPNPVRNTLHVDAHDQYIASAMLISAVGHRYPVSADGNTIDLSPYPSGVYYLQIVTNKSITQIKIIKQ